MTFDGVTPRLDLANGKVSSGRAATLYGPLPIVTTDCGPAIIAAPFVASSVGIALTCTVTTRRVPWLPGLGWAPGSSAWLITAVSTRGPQVLDRASGSKRTQFAVDGFDTPLAVRCGNDSALVVVAGFGGAARFASLAAHRRDDTSTRFTWSVVLK